MAELEVLNAFNAALLHICVKEGTPSESLPPDIHTYRFSVTHTEERISGSDVQPQINLPQRITPVLSSIKVSPRQWSVHLWVTSTSSLLRC